MSKKTCKKSCSEIWIVSENPLPLHSLSEMRAFSSAGSEHLPYKQRVGGSNPSTPTKLSFQGSLAQLNRAFDYGSKGYRFESYASHERCGEGYIPEWPNGADCKSAGFRLRWFESICTHSKIENEKCCGNSSVDRALAFQAGGRGFEPRFPLYIASLAQLARARDL